MQRIWAESSQAWGNHIHPAKSGGGGSYQKMLMSKKIHKHPKSQQQDLTHKHEPKVEVQPATLPDYAKEFIEAVCNAKC